MPRVKWLPEDGTMRHTNTEEYDTEAGDFLAKPGYLYSGEHHPVDEVSWEK